MTVLSEDYKRRLKNYLLWATMDNVGMAGSTKAICGGGSPDGLSPDEVMYRWETKGERNLLCTDLGRLYRYAAGKAVRDFYVSNWVSDVKDEMLVAEEVICTGGMDVEEFHRVFKRYPDPWLLRRIWLDRNHLTPNSERGNVEKWQRTPHRSHVVCPCSSHPSNVATRFKTRSRSVFLRSIQRTRTSIQNWWNWLGK